MPVISYGTWMLQGTECVNGVKEAVYNGYRHIDTAESYQNEHDIGGYRMYCS